MHFTCFGRSSSRCPCAKWTAGRKQVHFGQRAHRVTCVCQDLLHVFRSVSLGLATCLPWLMRTSSSPNRRDDSHQPLQGKGIRPSVRRDVLNRLQVIPMLSTSSSSFFGFDQCFLSSFTERWWDRLTSGFGGFTPRPRLQFNLACRRHWVTHLALPV